MGTVSFNNLAPGANVPLTFTIEVTYTTTQAGNVTVTAGGQTQTQAVNPPGAKIQFTFKFQNATTTDVTAELDANGQTLDRTTVTNVTFG